MKPHPSVHRTLCMRKGPRAKKRTKSASMGSQTLLGAWLCSQTCLCAWMYSQTCRCTCMCAFICSQICMWALMCACMCCQICMCAPLSKTKQQIPNKGDLAQRAESVKSRVGHLGQLGQLRHLQAVPHQHSILHQGNYPPWLRISSMITLGVMHTLTVLVGNQLHQG